MLVREANTKKFNHALAVLNLEHAALGKINDQSQGVYAEDTFLRLLNKLYGWHLVNENEHDPNAEAVDLIDRDEKIFVQVTTSCTSTKVRETLAKKATKDNGRDGYRIFFLFVGEQDKSIKTRSFDVPEGVSFKPKENLLLSADLDGRFKGLDIELQEEILHLIAVETGDSSYDPCVVDTKVIQSINAHLERKKANHPSFRLLEQASTDLLPKGVIPNSSRTVVPDGGEPISFGNFIKNSWESGSQCHLLITGEGGVGKTVALLTLATEEGFLPYGVAAVYIPLHELAQRCGDGPDEDCVDRFLAADFPGKGGALDGARQLACQDWDSGPSLILLMDGYNEIPNDRRSAVDRGIAKWASWPGVQVITTSRELATFSVRHMRRLRLEPLSRESARAYLESCGIERIPAPDDKMWQVIQTPLMLRLFVDCESFDGADEGYVALEEPDCAGHLVWNYMQRELVRCVKSKGKYKPIEYAAAILLTLPYVCWRMESDFKFSVDEKELHELVRLACSRWKDEDLSEAFMGVEGDRLGYLDDLGNLTSRRNVDKQLAILAEETALLTGRKDKDKKAVYSLMHQNFRDCLAALHVRNAMESDSDAIPDELREPLSSFTKGYLADLADDNLLGKVWETNRETLPTNVTVTHNLLGTIDRKRDGDFTALDWSGMDLTRISLAGYRKESKFHISSDHQRFNRTKLGIGCFVPQGHTETVYSVCFSPDGRLIASGSDDRTVRLWDATAGQVAMAPLEGHGSGVLSVCFSPDGLLLASGSSDGTVRLWDASTGKPAMPPLKGLGRRDGVESVCFSPDGHLLASGSRDGTMRLWDASTGKPAMPPLEGHGDLVSSVCFSPDGLLLASGSRDGTVRLWDASTGKPAMPPLEGHGDGVRSVCFSPDGRLLASGSIDGTVRLWDASTGRVAMEPLEVHGGVVFSVCFSPDGCLLSSGSSDGTVRLWDASTGRAAMAPLEGSGSQVWSVCFSPDGRLLATGSDGGAVRLWDTSTGRAAMAPLEGSGSQVWSVCFSPDGRLLASGSRDGTVRLWDTSTGRAAMEQLEGSGGWVNSVCFSPDGRLLASGSRDGTVRLWDASTGKPAMPPLEGRGGAVWSVCFSPDGRLLASGSTDGAVRLWDASSGRAAIPPLKGLRHSGGAVTAVCFSPDGRLLASGNFVQAVLLWDASAGRESTAPLKGHPGLVRAVCFSPDGHLLASGSSDGTVRLWDASAGELIRTITPLYGINLIGLDFSLSEITESDRETLRQNGVRFESSP